MQSTLRGTIIIPKGSYEGSGEAFLFLRKDNQNICDKVVYIYTDSNGEFESDQFHHPLKVMMSCWQACIPSLKIHYDLKEKED